MPPRCRGARRASARCRRPPRRALEVRGRAAQRCARGVQRRQHERAPVSATPALPTFTPMPSNKNFKVAPSDIIQFDENNIEIQLITNLLFEDVGAVELSDMSRSDLIDGQQVIYSPITNLPELKRDFDPNKIISNIPMVDYFSRFLIDLLSRGMYEPYFDDEGNLVIEIDKVLDDEKIEAEILSNGTIEIIGEI